MEACPPCPAGSSLALHYKPTEREQQGCCPALRPLGLYSHPYAGLFLGLETDLCQMLPLDSVLTAAGLLASCFVESGPGFHQILIGLGLAFPASQSPTECGHCLFPPPSRTVPGSGC